MKMKKVWGLLATFSISLWIQNLTAQTTVSLPGRTIVKLLADNSRPKMYALNSGVGTSPGTLLALNPTNGTLLSEIVLDLDPTDMTMTAAGDSLYVISAGSRSLTKVDLSAFGVTATRTISTPNTYSTANPLYVAAGASNIVYYTDGGWSPGVYAFNFQAGTNLSLFDDDNGAGGLATTRDGKTLYTWRQYGWGAGNVNSWVTRYDVSSATPVPLETSFVSWRRDPLDTPLLLNRSETQLFNKQQLFVATNVSQLVQEFPEDIYAITPDGSIVFGNTGVFVSATGMQIKTLGLSSTVQAVAGNQQVLFRYNSLTSELALYALADILGAGWDTNQAPVGAFVRTPTNATTLSTIAFDGSPSSDDQGNGTLQYRWDWDNDGAFDTQFTNQPVATHRYSIAGTKTVRLQVKDCYGVTGVTQQTFDVVQQDDPGQPGGGNPLYEVQFSAADVAFDPLRPFAYLSDNAGKRLAVLNLTNGLTQRVFAFDWNPESIAISPNGQRMYVALLRRPHSSYWFGGHTNYIAEFDLAQQAMTRQFTILADPGDLAVTDSGILIVPGGSDQWTDIRTYRVSTGELLGTSGIREMSRIALHPNQQAIYATDLDLTRYTFDPATGAFLTSWDSPYNGEYSTSGNVWCLPSGTNILVRSGVLLSSSSAQTQDMRYLLTLEGGVAEGADTDVAHNALFTVGSSTLCYYNLGTFALVQKQALTNNALYVHAANDHIFVASPESGRTLFQRFPNPAVGAETNQAPVAAFQRTPTNATTLTPIIFDGSSSTDDQGGGTALQYRWDWDNDGVYDTSFTNQPVTAHRYYLAGTKTVTLQVKDPYGASTVVRQTFGVLQQDDPGQPGGGNPPYQVQFPASDVVFDPGRPYAYLSWYAGKQLAVLNLTNGFIERVFNLEWNPESIVISPNGQKMYVALLRRPHSSYWFGGHTNYIAEFDVNRQLKINQFEILADPYDLAVTDGGILIVPGGSDQWTDIRTYRTSTGELLSTSSIRQMCRISLHPGQQSVYTADTDSGPSDIQHYQFDPVTGVFGASWDSPYHGDYPMNGDVWCVPSGGSVLVRGGGLFASSSIQSLDMRYQSTLAAEGVADVAVDLEHNALLTIGVVGSPLWLRHYDLSSFQLVSSQEITNATQFIHAQHRDVYLAWTNTTATFFQRIQNPALPDAFITQPPQSQTVLAGATTTMLVAVRGVPPFQYQWFFQDAPLAGQTNASLILSNVRSDQEGDYRVSVSNVYASVTSVVAHLTVLVQPSIVEQPQSTSANAGGIVTFEVHASGSPVLSYQWSFEGIELPGATASSYSITNVQLGNVGVYQVKIQNTVGTVLSAPASLRVLPAAPIVVANPAAQTISAGADVQFSVAFQGTEPIRCQWWFNGTPLANANSSTLVITNVQATSSGTYNAWLSNSVGATSSATVTLTVLPAPPWFVLQPIGVSVQAGSNVILKAAARGSVPLGYQWQKDGVELTNEVNSVLLLTNSYPSQSGAYNLVASNLYGSATSSVVSVVISGIPPKFVSQPLDANVELGDTLILSSLATGSAPLTYGWWFNGSLLPAQTNRVLTVTNVQSPTAGNYLAVASNAFGMVTSSLARVTVLMPARFLSQFQNQVTASGREIVLGAEAQGTAPVTYSWYFNGLSLVSETNATLQLTNVQQSQTGVYRVVANNRDGSANSLITVWVFDPPGAVVAWGDNGDGQSSVPDSLVEAVQASGGDFHSLALQPNGTVVGWGFDGNGQAAPPLGLSNVVSIAAGAYHSLALTVSGRVVAWGLNDSGQASIPLNATSVVAVAAGEGHSVAIRQDGTVAVWGDNTLGQQNVPANSGFLTSVAAGRNHTVALRNDGTVIAWGLNSCGQTSVPLALTDIKAIAAGYLHSLALRHNGTVVAWGDNTYRQTAVPAGLSNVVAIAAGEYHSYALVADGTVAAWGDDHWGQLELPPVVHHVEFLGSGYYHGLATIAPMLNWSRTRDQLVFSWAGPFTLEQAESPVSQFVPVSTISPYTNCCSFTNAMFRLRRHQ